MATGVVRSYCRDVISGIRVSRRIGQLASHIRPSPQFLSIKNGQESNLVLT
jgi:hypothetical protein